MTKKEKMIRVFLVLFGCITGIVFMIPVLLTVFKSFLLDGHITLNGYFELFFNCFPFYQFFWNSIFYTVIISFATLVISIPAAFAFKFARFPGKNILFILYIILMMMPLQVMILPNYIGLRELGFLNTPIAIILPAVFSPLGVVIIHQYMKESDVQVVEAGRLDTNSCIRIMIHCVMPQIKVCVFAVALFVFAENWNMVEQPMLYVNDDRLRTLTSFVIQSDMFRPEVLLPASVLFVIPVFISYLLFHQELKEGLKL